MRDKSMKLFYLVAVIFFSVSICPALGEEWVESISHKSDVNDDGEIDHFNFLVNNNNPSTVKFMMFVSLVDGNYAKINTREIENFGCGGSCWVNNVYFKNGSAFIEASEKSGDGYYLTRYQFKERNKIWSLIGVKQTYQTMDIDDAVKGYENEEFEIINDFNWVTGDYIKTIKYSDGSINKTNKILKVNSVNFTDFDFVSEQKSRIFE